LISPRHAEVSGATDCLIWAPPLLSTEPTPAAQNGGTARRVNLPDRVTDCELAPPVDDSDRVDIDQVLGPGQRLYPTPVTAGL
jgi:hypothetical protein